MTTICSRETGRSREVTDRYSNGSGSAKGTSLIHASPKHIGTPETRRRAGADIGTLREPTLPHVERQGGVSVFRLNVVSSKPPILGATVDEDAFKQLAEGGLIRIEGDLYNLPIGDPCPVTSLRSDHTRVFANSASHARESPAAHNDRFWESIH